MPHIALRMLFGDRAKYVTLVLGLAFAALLMNQQGAIFMGLLNQATGPLQNVTQPGTEPDVMGSRFPRSSYTTTEEFEARGC